MGRILKGRLRGRWQVRRRRRRRQRRRSAHGRTAFLAAAAAVSAIFLFTAVLAYCDTGSGRTLVEIADSQVGNEGGKKYWKWYGFDEPCDWCACFVSWCIAGDQTLDEEEMPRFAYCQDGVRWFVRRNRWASRNTQPIPGMIIFFDGNGNGTADHVGIVKSAQNGKIETIEGDSGDRCEENLYDADCETVMGYGILGRDTGR